MTMQAINSRLIYGPVLLLLATCAAFLHSAEGDRPPWPREVKPGCLVSYTITRPAADAAAPSRVECSLLVLRVYDGKLDLEFTVQGIGSRLSVVRDGFSPATLLGAARPPQELTAVDTDTQYKPAQMPAAIPATKTVWKGDNSGTELIRSPEIPFGLASLQSGGLRLETTSYSWGDK